MTFEELPEAADDENEDEEEDDAAPLVDDDEADASLEIMAKKEETSDEADDTEEDSMLTAEPDERVGVLPARVAPQQETEFVCKNCFLVKHRSQLADKRRMFCKDCA